MTDRVEDGRHGVRLRMAASVDFDGDDDLLLLGFHGFGNDEHEMIRIIDALYAGTGREPNYISFRGTYDRPFIGNSYWYPDGCGVAERRRECTRVGEAVVKLLRSPVYDRFRKVLIGFSQGGYLSYRMVLEHPDVFDAAVLMSPSFKGEEDAKTIEGSTWFALCYGDGDHTIPANDQRNAREVLARTGRLFHHVCPGLGHSINDEEIAALHSWLFGADRA